MQSHSQLSHTRIGAVQASCLLVVPCYNEEARLNLSAFESFFAQSEPNEIGFLFVNDGSRDGTLALLKGFQAAQPERVMVLDLAANSGKAEAVRQGMLLATSQPGVESTGFWDADLATPLYELPWFLKILASNQKLEMIFGARIKILGRDVHRKLLRHYLGRCFATVASLVLHLPIYDTQCGAKIFRVTDTLRAILDKPFHSRWIFDVELIARYIKTSGHDRAQLLASLYEYPLSKWEDVKGSKVGPFDFLRAFGELWWIYLSNR